VPDEALAATYAFPDVTLPVFAALMLGGTLGGNATVIGASSNIVAAGISRRAGSAISFLRFLRIGGPVAVVQIAVASAYVYWLHLAARP
jgi:Na+/H+ antiporter NhaD/arsenite permease-like protein